MEKEKGKGREKESQWVRIKWLNAFSRSVILIIVINLISIARQPSPSPARPNSDDDFVMTDSGKKQNSKTYIKLSFNYALKKHGISEEVMKEQDR